MSYSDNFIENISTCNSVERLFALWRKAHAEEPEESCMKSIPQFDGQIINKAAFLPDGSLTYSENMSNGISHEVLFILKESNDPSGKDTTDSPDFWFRDEIQKDSSTNQMKRRFGCILEHLSYSRPDMLAVTPLSKCAFLNINKRGGFGQTHDPTLKYYFEQYKHFAYREVELLNPKIIVACLGPHYRYRDIYEQLYKSVQCTNGGFYTSWHPSARCNDSDFLQHVESYPME